MKRVSREQLSDADACAMDSACDSARARRERNRALGHCINENRRGDHGKATHGVRCQRCYEQHRRSQ